MEYLKDKINLNTTKNLTKFILYQEILLRVPSSKYMYFRSVKNPLMDNRCSIRVTPEIEI